MTTEGVSLQHRRWRDKGAFEVEQHEARADGGLVISLEHRGCRFVDWRLATREAWRREFFLVDGELAAAGVHLRPGRWTTVPFGVPVVSSLHCRFVLVAHQRPRRPQLPAFHRTDLAGLLDRVRTPSPRAAPRLRAVHLATSVATVTNALEASPTSIDLTALLNRPARSVSEAAKTYFQAFHATVGSWRDYLHFLRLELGVSAFSAGLGTAHVARWLGFRHASSLLHSFAREGLPSPGALRKAAALDEPASSAAWTRLFSGQHPGI
jgi:methylphosphotriester-DNA--protein-cysteine methyltransferase